MPSTSGAMHLQKQKSLLEPPHHLEQRRSSVGLSGRCPDCGKKREDAVSYTIEDLDAVDGAPLESNFPGQVCQCDNTASVSTSPPEVAPSSSRPHPDLRKYCSVETSRWTGNYLSPEDIIWDLKHHAGEDTEYRWALHTSRTDADINRRTKCNCHDLTPEEKRHPDRSDLRKHHSAETDKWSLRPDHPCTPPHDLRKHLSDASGMAREPGQPVTRTLQVPEVVRNPKPRCTCPKSKSPITSPAAEKRTQRFQDQENKILFSKSLTPEETPAPVPIVERPELKKHASADTRAPVIKRERGRLVQQKAIVGSSKKWEPKDRIGGTTEEDRKAQRSKWAGMAHFSLQPEKKDYKHSDAKSKSLKERQRYSVRRSLSPDPDPRRIVRVDSRIVKRLISPEIMITADAKWAPYEGYSPLPSMGMKKREPKRISEIKWTPYDGSASELSILEVPEDKEVDDYHITPTCHPPPRAPSMKEEDDEEERERWRFLNQISPFPIYQGAWKDESPEKTPPRIITPEDLEPPIWTPMEPPPTPVRRRRPSQITLAPPEPVKPVKESKKKKLKNRSESAQVKEGTIRLAPPTVIVRASSEDQKSRQRPLLTRSKALLDVPRKGIDATKRSHSEEVPRYRSKDAHHGPSRAKSEEASRYPWGDDEVRQYVTTV